MDSVSCSTNVASVSTVSLAPSDALSEVPSDVIARKRIQYGSRTEAAVGVFMEYCRNSTIHGVRYLGQRKRPLIERIFWILVFVVAIYTCTHLIGKIYRKWEDTPVIVSFDERKAPVWNIPFPSVILCPETKARGDAFNFSKVYKYVKNQQHYIENISNADLTNFRAFIHLCDLEISTSLNLDSNDTVDIGETLFNMAHKMNNSAPFCRFGGVTKMCEEYFSYVQTDDGICYQFNGLNRKDLLRDPGLEEDDVEVAPFTTWNMETGYSPTITTEQEYPRRVRAAGKLGALIFTPQGSKFDLDYLCRGSMQGFRVYLQAPDDAPQAAKQFIRVPFGQEILIKINPQYRTTSESLRKYKPEERQCFFRHEKQLRFFKIYTQKNCDLECLVNFTISKCDCIKYSMPIVDGVRICGSSDIDCYNQAEDEVLQREFEVAVESSKRLKYWKTTCNCLPSCTSLEYEFEITQAYFDAWKLLKAYRDDYLDLNPGLLMSRVSMFFKEQHFITVRRAPLYNTTDFIANCGGLLALFMGVSFLSLIELIYFCSVRLSTNIKMRKEKREKRISSVFQKGPKLF